MDTPTPPPALKSDREQAPEGALTEAQLAEMLSGLESARRGGGLERLRELPSGTRLALALAATALGPAALVHGEHFLVGVGAFVELTYPLCADVAGDVTLYIPNFDEPGSRALHELVVRRGDDEQIIAEATDEEAGQSGYNPFVRVIAGEDPAAAIGDTLVLRSTNLNGVAFSVMVWRPPSEYDSWILVEVE